MQADGRGERRAAGSSKVLAVANDDGDRERRRRLACAARDGSIPSRMTSLLSKQNLLAISACVGLFGSVACGDKPSNGGTASESTGAADSSGGETDAPTTTGGPSTATGDDASGSSGSGETSGMTSTGTTTGETGDDTTGGELCEIEPAACGFAGQLGNEVEDCGVVDPWDDDTAAWQAAHDCAVAAAAEQRSFCLVTVLQGIDSAVAQAYAAQEARSYALATFFFDSDPCGGGGCGPTLSQSSCATLTAIDGCVIEPGNACLSCDGQGESSQICGP